VEGCCLCMCICVCVCVCVCVNGRRDCLDVILGHLMKIVALNLLLVTQDNYE
jgi:hypothetical protein